MPATFVLLRIGWLVLPLPWFLLWVVLSPLALLAWLLGAVGTAISGRWEYRTLLQAPRVLLLLVMLHGLCVDVRESEGRSFAISWV